MVVSEREEDSIVQYKLLLPLKWASDIVQCTVTVRVPVVN